MHPSASPTTPAASITLVPTTMKPAYQRPTAEDAWDDELKPGPYSNDHGNDYGNDDDDDDDVDEWERTPRALEEAAGPSFPPSPSLRKEGRPSGAPMAILCRLGGGLGPCLARTWPISVFCWLYLRSTDDTRVCSEAWRWDRYLLAALLWTLLGSAVFVALVIMMGCFLVLLDKTLLQLVYMVFAWGHRLFYARAKAGT